MEDSSPPPVPIPLQKEVSAAAAADDDEEEEEEEEEVEDYDDDYILFGDPVVTTGGDLPDLEKVIAAHALHFLPVGSVFRFRAVSSYWRQRISAPIFARDQTLHNRSLAGVFLCQPDEIPPSIYVPFHPAAANAIPDPLLSFLPHGRSHILSSSSGLLLCSFTRPNPLPQPYLVCNPATTKWAEVPPAPSASLAVGVVLDFTPSLSNISGDYRIICTFRITGWDSDATSLGFEVFSSADAEWRLSSQVISGELLSQHGLAVGGKACWRTTEGAILCYDPDRDAATVVSLPEDIATAQWQIGELAGKLRCVGFPWEDELVNVYEFIGDDAGGRWDLVRSVDVGHGMHVRPLPVQGVLWDVVLWVEGQVVGFRPAASEGVLLLSQEVLWSPELLPYVSTLGDFRSCGVHT